MQVVLNGKSYTSPLTYATAWNLVEILERDHGWTRISSTPNTVCLKKELQS